MKVVNVSVCFGLIFAIMLSLARFDALCQDMRDNVFRLHIIAASDSAEDQALKLKVRDAILESHGQVFTDCKDIDDAISVANDNTAEFLEIAKTVIEENGFDYNVTAQVDVSYFENREYDDFTLPAGNYEALNIIIGEGKGKNWWCVMFPAVCIGAAGELNDSVSNESAYVAEHRDKYEIRFKTVEIYEDLKKIFTKKKK